MVKLDSDKPTLNRRRMALMLSAGVLAVCSFPPLCIRWLSRRDNLALKAERAFNLPFYAH
jgi:hypothetical protein